MKLKSLIVFFVTVSVHGQNSVHSQSVDFSNALKAATSPLTITAAGDLEGTGGIEMTDAIRDAQFVLIGESHFSRETPAVAAAVCRAMRPDRYAIEVGPYAAAYVNGLLQVPQRKILMKEREHDFPDNMAFLNVEQENDLAATCMASSQEKGEALWGLDQEFEGAAPVLLHQMDAQPNGKVSAAAIRSALAKDRQAEAKARSTGDLTQLFLTSATDNDVSELQAALNTDGTQTSQAIMREFVASRRIYRMNSSDPAASNSERASLLKQHFLDRYRSLQREKPAPRILMKFGDNHMWKGFNETHQLDLGDFVAELASVEHSTSLHIEVIAVKGKLGLLSGYARPLKEEAFVLADTAEYGWLKPLIEMLPNEKGGQGTVVVDLRKLRFRSIAMPSEWQRFVYGYDLLVMLPEFTPSNLYR
jgi:hypothetical protein